MNKLIKTSKIIINENSFLTSKDGDPSFFFILQLLLTSAFTYVIGIAVASTNKVYTAYFFSQGLLESSGKIR